MAHLPDAALEAKLTDLESIRVARKSTWSREVRTKAREAVCAFANDLPGSGEPGVLFVGAEDDGRASGLEISDRLLLELTAIRQDGNIVPPPSLTVEKRHLQGADYAVVTVTPADYPPVRYAGRIWVRSGPRRGLATAQDERILNERRRAGDQPFDLRPVDWASVDDLSVARFTEEYLPGAFAADVLAANARSLEERLAATKMIASVHDPTPTVLGVLTLCPAAQDFLPGAYVQFLRIDGTTRADPIVGEGQGRGPLARVVERIELLFDAHNATAVDVAGARLERRRSLYPASALQQLFRNAIMHRSYEATNAPISVTWFNDRVEILSPGGPYGEVSVDNFGRPGYVDYRNPNLAGAMRDLDLVQRFGIGIEIARAALAGNGNPPLEYEVTTSHVRAILRPNLDYAYFAETPRARAEQPH